MLNEQQFYLFGQIQTSQTGCQLYSDTSPFGECSLVGVTSPLTTEINNNALPRYLTLIYLSTSVRYNRSDKVTPKAA